MVCIVQLQLVLRCCEIAGMPKEPLRCLTLSPVHPPLASLDLHYSGGLVGPWTAVAPLMALCTDPHEDIRSRALRLLRHLCEKVGDRVKRECEVPGWGMRRAGSACRWLLAKWLHKAHLLLPLQFSRYLDADRLCSGVVEAYRFRAALAEVGLARLCVVGMQRGAGWQRAPSCCFRAGDCPASQLPAALPAL